MRKLSIALMLCLISVPGLGDDTMTMDEAKKQVAMCTAKFRDHLQIHEHLIIQHRDAETQTPHLKNEIALRADRRKQFVDLLAQMYEIQMATVIIVVNALKRGNHDLAEIDSGVQSVLLCN